MIRVTNKKGVETHLYEKKIDGKKCMLITLTICLKQSVAPLSFQQTVLYSVRERPSVGVNDPVK